MSSNHSGEIDFLRHLADTRDCITAKISDLIERLRSLQAELLQELLSIENEYKTAERDKFSKQILVQWDNKIEDILISEFCKLIVIEKLASPSLQDPRIRMSAVSPPPLDNTENSVFELSGFALNMPDITTLNNHSEFDSHESISNPESAYNVPKRSQAPPEPSTPPLTDSYELMRNKPRGLIEMYQSVSLPAYSVCSYGSENSQLQSPRGVAIEKKSNRIYIADRGNQRIQVFSDSGKFVFSFTHPEMQGPKGICVKENVGLVFVTVCDKNSVHSYTLDGQFVRKVGLLGYGPGRFNQPCGITTDNLCRVYVCDFGNDRVQVFNRDLHYLTILTNKVTKPTDIKVVKEDVFILDQRKLCISIFTRGGAFIDEIVTCGPEWYQVKHPYFFDIDYMGNLLVSDLANHCIKVFSPRGEFLCSVGVAGEEEGQFLQPRGIALVDDCIVTICDRMNYQLQIFILNSY